MLQAPGCRSIGQVRGVGRQVVGVVAVAVPHGHEDAVACNRTHAHAVDESLTRGRVPGIDGVAAVGVVVRAVEILQSRNIVLHQGLRGARTSIGVAVRRTADVATVGHDRVFNGIVVRGDRAERIGRVVPVHETQCMSDLMQERVTGIVPDDRIVVAAARRPVPGIAAIALRRRIVAPGGRGRVGPGEAQVGVIGRRLRHLGEREVRHRSELLECESPDEALLR